MAINNHKIRTNFFRVCKIRIPLSLMAKHLEVIVGSISSYTVL